MHRDKQEDRQSPPTAEVIDRSISYSANQSFAVKVCFDSERHGVLGMGRMS